jgi:hypothetical protein
MRCSGAKSFQKARALPPGLSVASRVFGPNLIVLDSSAIGGRTICCKIVTVKGKSDPPSHTCCQYEQHHIVVMERGARSQKFEAAPAADHYKTSTRAGIIRVADGHPVVVLIGIAIRSAKADLPMRCMHVMKLTATPEES